MNTARDQNTGANFNLNDKTICEQQIDKRKDKKTKSSLTTINIGDTLRLRNTNDKHKASDVYVVTRKDNEDRVGVQKLLHPLRKDKGKL